MCGVSNTGKADCTVTQKWGEFEQSQLLTNILNYLLQKQQVNVFYNIEGEML